MKRPNALHPDKMTPAEWRAELCSLFALALVRLKLKNKMQDTADNGESRLHSPPNQCLHATPTHRRTA